MEIPIFTLFALIASAFGIGYLITDYYLNKQHLAERLEYTSFIMDSLIAAGYVRSKRMEISPGVWGYSIIRWNASSKDIANMEKDMANESNRLNAILRSIRSDRNNLTSNRK